MFWEAMFRWLVSQRLYFLTDGLFIFQGQAQKIVCVHDALESKLHAVVSVIPHDL